MKLLAAEVSAHLQTALDRLNEVEVPAAERSQLKANAARISSLAYTTDYSALIGSLFKLESFDRGFLESINKMYLPIDKLVLDNMVNISAPINKIMLDNMVNISAPINKIMLDSIANMYAPINKIALDNIANMYAPINKSLWENVAASSVGTVWNALRGVSLPRDIDISVNPWFSDQLPPQGAGIAIEVLETVNPDEDSKVLPALTEGSEDDVEDLGNFELEWFPLVIPTTTNDTVIQHRIRKPSEAEWMQWASDINRWRRYLTPEEIEEERLGRDDGEEIGDEMYESGYQEILATEKLYDAILVGIAGVQLDENDDFAKDQFRELEPKFVRRIPFGLKRRVIRAVYECYCWRDETNYDEAEGERRVYQKIPIGSETAMLLHTLRSPTAEESLEFRRNIVKGTFAQNDEKQEILELSLDLSLAARFYNELLLKVYGATAGGTGYSADSKQAFLDAINPVYKFRVVEALLGLNAWNFDIDSFLIS